LRDHLTMRVGGSARLFAEGNSVADVEPHMLGQQKEVSRSTP
jgi:hypothetical protein